MLLTLCFYLTRLRTLRRTLSLDCGRDGLVLDVGSGHRPHPRADVLVERYLDDDWHRSGQAVVTRSTVVADVAALPFPDRVFSFVICRHLLEHVDAPAAALRELGRVGHRGYIETPSPLWEKVVGHQPHRWLVERRGNTLHLERKPPTVPYPDLAPGFLDLNARSLAWHILLMENFDHFYTTLTWTDRIDFEVHNGDADAPASAATDLSETEQQSVRERKRLPQSRASRLVRGLILRGLTRVMRRPRTVDILSILVCPACKQPVAPVMDGSELACRGCRRHYPLRDGVPIMLVEAARLEATSV